MIVKMNESGTAQTSDVAEALRASGYEAHALVFPFGQFVVGIGPEREDAAPFEKLPGVEWVVANASGPVLASIERSPERSVVRMGGSSVGASSLAIIAGPCSVEDRTQIVTAARFVAAYGATALRGGAYKPRTSPYSFQGLGKEGLAFLHEASQATGLPIVTEVMEPADVEQMAPVVDCLQVGARSMQNYPLLRAVGRSGKPVLLKRGPAAGLSEFLLAAEYVLVQGNPNVILCERGIKTFETSTRNTLDLNAVPILKGKTHLPVIVDPSHGTGRQDAVIPMARAAVAAGADGLIVEVHPDPAHARSDGDQSLTLAQFRQLVEEIRPVAEAVGKRVEMSGASQFGANGAGQGRRTAGWGSGS